MMPIREEEEPLRNGGDGGGASSILSTCARISNVGAIGILSAVSVFLFVQLQAVTLRVASEQQQIDDLKDQIKNQQMQTEDINEKVEKEHDLTVFHMAGTFTLLTCLITMFHMTAHLRSFNQPFVQRKILAILWMSPIYSVTSFFSLVFPAAEGYLGIIKDFYEAYVIYTFLSFLIAVLGRGDRDAVVEVLARHADHLDRPYKFLGCLFHPPPEESARAMSNAVLLECQVLALQFVFMRPLTSVIKFVISTVDSADDDDSGSGWSFFYSPTFFIMMVQNISVFFAFAGLLKFYHAVRDDLAWCQPFSKFITIKGIVFMTFWQGLVISIVFNMKEGGRWSEDDDDSSKDPTRSSEAIQNLLICVEMMFFSIGHWCVFPTDEWTEGYKVKFFQRPGFGFKDFADDISTIVESGKASRRARRNRKNGMTSLPSDEDTVQSAEEGELHPSEESQSSLT